ncbi:MAG: alpha/beta hydrolase [Alphaproteobacteria bacterium]|nr:alpha/beta hydrolase [Alphaproteobacteria bacterium]
MRSRFFTAKNSNCEHRLHYTEWGPEAAPAVLCIHGLTQTARSFDALAEHLSRTRRVICLDVAGRGRSDWLPDSGDYGFPQYVADASALIASLGLAPVDLVGTSMGGLIGIFLAAQDPTPVRRLVLNDVGPFVPKEAVGRIRDYVGTDPEFPDIEAYEEYLRVIWAPFGPLTDAQWRHLAETSARHTETGAIVPAYDMRIREPIEAAPVEDADLWAFWDAVSVPALVLRGADSDILLSETAQEMTRRGPKAGLVEFQGVGHAPALMSDDQIAAIADFLA